MESSRQLRARVAGSSAHLAALAPESAPRAAQANFVGWHGPQLQRMAEWAENSHRDDSKNTSRCPYRAPYAGPVRLQQFLLRVPSMGENVALEGLMFDDSEHLVYGMLPKPGRAYLQDRFPGTGTPLRAMVLYMAWLSGSSNSKTPFITFLPLLCCPILPPRPLSPTGGQLPDRKRRFHT